MLWKDTWWNVQLQQRDCFWTLYLISWFSWWQHRWGPNKLTPMGVPMALWTSRTNVDKERMWTMQTIGPREVRALPLDYFSPRRGCLRVLKLCMGSYFTKLSWFHYKKFFTISLFKTVDEGEHDVISDPSQVQMIYCVRH